MAFSLQARINAAQNNNRQDGMNNVSAEALCQFQAAVERMANADYNKLREVLKVARGNNYSYEQLMSLYNSR